MKLDFDKLEKAAEDMDNLNYFQVIMDFINKRFPDKVKKNE
jgi:hypothetical protein